MAEDMFGLAGAVALVTGGGGGIPKAVALKLAAAGADVAVVDLAEEYARQTVKEIEALGRRAVAIGADVRKPDEVKAMVETTRSELGPLRAAVNGVGSLGGATPKSFLDFTLDEWNGPIELNLTSALLCTQAEAIAMAEDGIPGAIVNFASTSGVTSAPSIAHYGAANAAVIHLTSSAAMELAPYGIRVNCVVPGTHAIDRTGRETATSSRPEHKEFMRKTGESIPLGRLGDADSTAGVALFLASTLSAYVTGHAVASDGGLLHTTRRPPVGQLRPQALERR